MKPKTKLHYEILKLHAKLPKISEAMISWAYKRNFKFWCWKTKHKVVCFECGHGWDLETTLITKLFPIICPKCGKELQPVDTHAWRKTDCEYFQIMTVVGDFQVIRVVQMYHYCMKSVEAHYSWHEIYQHWIKSDGKFNIMSTGFNGMGFFMSGQGWTWNGPMELRANQNDRYFINGVPTYPKKKIHPNIIRNGFKGEYHQYNPGYFFAMLLSTPLFETFLKAGQFSLLSEFSHMDYRIKKYWTQIRICMRNNYCIKDASNWFDYLELLSHFHKNIYDPAVICPEDLTKVHNDMVAQKRAIDERNRAAAQEKADNENLAFKNAKKKLMHLEFTDGKITIVPLKNVTDFKKEEKTLNHCVYTSGYHKKNGSFIMSARIGEERLETIEISLRDFKVMQCRGYDNLDSKFHKQILELISHSLSKIRAAFYAPEKQKVKRKLKLVA